jgi:hypothetical protein
MRILAVTFALALTVAVAATAFAQGRFVTIEAPDAVQVGTAFDVAVSYGGDSPSTRLRAEVHAGTVCPTVGQGEPIATLATDARFATPQQRLATRVEGTIGPGAYLVCAWVTDKGVTALSATKTVQVEPLSPTRVQPWTIRPTRAAVNWLGPLEIDEVRPPQLQFFYGREPTSRRAFAKGTGCVVRWRHLGLRIRLAYFGAGGTACSDGLVQSFSIGGKRMYGRVSTRAGLRLGDRLRTLRTLHPRATQRSASVWWLRAGVSEVGERHRYAILAARIRDGRVHSFAGHVGAAGD